MISAMSRLTGWLRKTNEWPFAHPGVWSIIAGTTVGLLWFVTEMAYETRPVVTTLIAAATLAIICGLFTYVLTRWQRSRQLDRAAGMGR
jgi:uncharacterized membrane protein (DUF106 family)